MTKPKCIRWAVDLSTWTPTLTQLTQAIASVQPEERERLIRFHFIDDFLSSLVGRLLMRKFISDFSGLNYQLVNFSRDARGKPYWNNKNSTITTTTLKPNDLPFNVSHQGDYVVLAGLCCNDSIPTNVDYGIGVDVMKIEYSGSRSLNEFFRILNKKFSEHEWRFIKHSQHNQIDQLKAFMRNWCLKESYVKELGVGITIDLERISFSIDNSKELSVEEPLNGTTLRFNDNSMINWHFEEHLLHPRYCAAIAFKNFVPTIENFNYLSIDNLLVESENSKNEEIINYCRNAIQKPRKKT